MGCPCPQPREKYELTGMCSNMDFEVLASGELLVTLVAVEGFLARVHAQMIDQFVFCLKNSFLFDSWSNLECLEVSWTALPETDVVARFGRTHMDLTEMSSHVRKGSEALPTHLPNLQKGILVLMRVLVPSASYVTAIHSLPHLHPLALYRRRAEVAGRMPRRGRMLEGISKREVWMEVVAAETVLMQRIGWQDLGWWSLKKPRCSIDAQLAGCTLPILAHGICKLSSSLVELCNNATLEASTGQFEVCHGQLRGRAEGRRAEPSANSLDRFFHEQKEGQEGERVTEMCRKDAYCVSVSPSSSPPPSIRQGHPARRGRHTSTLRLFFLTKTHAT